MLGKDGASADTPLQLLLLIVELRLACGAVAHDRCAEKEKDSGPGIVVCENCENIHHKVVRCPARPRIMNNWGP